MKKEIKKGKGGKAANAKRTVEVTKGQPKTHPVYITDASHRALKIHAANIGVPMTVILAEAIENIIGEWTIEYSKK